MPLVVRSDLEILSLAFCLSPVQNGLKDHSLLGNEGIPGHNDLQCVTISQKHSDLRDISAYASMIIKDF